MYSHVLDWLNIILRWIHIVAGIAWIGSSFFFMWLDSALTKPEQERKGVAGELWMTHSGGFYQVEKRKIGPGELPKTLHWFKYEAFFTWLSGIFLLMVVYYLTGGIYLIDPAVSSITSGQAMGLGIGLILLSWVIYDTMFKSKLGQKAPKVGGAIAFVLLTLLTYTLTHFLSGRAAYIHVGAILGTLMVANVWMRILPAQRKMIAATDRGEAPDFALGERAKTRSIHNNYMTFPLIFIMFSNHFPSTYGHPLNWLVLMLIMIAGAGVKHVMNVGSKAAWIFIPVVALVVGLFVMTDPSRRTIAASQASAPGQTVSFSEIKSIVETRCHVCHSANPVDNTFGPSPVGIQFDDITNVQKYAERIMVRVVQLKNMPFANKTNMTDEERAKLGAWIQAGAKID